MTNKATVPATASQPTQKTSLVGGMTRRSAIELIAGAACALPFGISIAGPTRTAQFEPTWESLQQYRCPQWFRDAKLGLFAHWGPQAVPRQGDWYARNMYIEGHRHYQYHVEHYGHPSKFGYKDIIPLWKAENWDPQALMRRYKKAGAKYFVALGCHHDNFACWNSKTHRWNSVNFGPKKDIVGLWKKAALEQGLRFGVTEHIAWSWSWFNVNKGADKTGPYAGVPYDGNDPKYQDLYHEPHEENAAHYPVNAPEIWKQRWYERVSDLVAQHQPDLLFTDGGIPFGQYGLRQLANFYNGNIARNGGKLEAVYNLKKSTKAPDEAGLYGEYHEGVGVLDLERGVVDGIQAEPWQCDTSVGDWFYREDLPYRKVENVIHMLVDAVSKNGNMMLNFQLLPDGTLDAEASRILDNFTK
ncbi:MAG: alpha-L-fucosidase, partial [Verrucomicrobiota bacterium]